MDAPDPQFTPWPPVEDPVTAETLVAMYRAWSSNYLEQIRTSLLSAEAYNRKRREAIETILADRKARHDT